VLAAKDAPTASTLDLCDSDATISEEGSSSGEQVPQPRLVKFLELSQINWEKLAKQQEWRTSIQVRGLPPSLSEKVSLKELLVQHSLQDDVLQVTISSGKKARFGVALLQASSVPAVGRLAKFFHGRVFSMSQMPISVCFASSQPKRSKFATASLTEPRHVAMSLATAQAGTGSPSMELGRPATIGCLLSWTEIEASRP